MYWFYNDVCFLPVINILGSKNALIFEIGIFSNKKVNLIGTFGSQNWKLQVVLKVSKKYLMEVQNYQRHIGLIIFYMQFY